MHHGQARAVQVLDVVVVQHRTAAQEGTHDGMPEFVQHRGEQECQHIAHGGIDDQHQAPSIRSHERMYLQDRNCSQNDPKPKSAEGPKTSRMITEQTCWAQCHK